MRTRTLLGLALLTINLLGCAGPADPPSPPSVNRRATVYLLNASPDAPALDVYLDGERRAEALPFRKIVVIDALSAENHDIALRQAGGAGDPLTRSTMELKAGGYTLLVAVGRLRSGDPAPFGLRSDEFYRNALERELRTLHLAPGLPPVTVRYGDKLMAEGVKYGEESPYQAFPDELPQPDVLVVAAGGQEVLEAGGVLKAGTATESVTAILLGDGAQPGTGRGLSVVVLNNQTGVLTDLPAIKTGT